MVDSTSDRAQIGNKYPGYLRFTGIKAVQQNTLEAWVEEMKTEAKAQGISGCFNVSTEYNVIPTSIDGAIHGGGYIHMCPLETNNNTFSELLLGKKGEDGKPILPQKILYMNTEEVKTWYAWKKNTRMAESDRKMFDRAYEDYIKFYTLFEKKEVPKDTLSKIFTLFARREKEDAGESEENLDISKYREKYNTKLRLEELRLELRRFAKCEEFELEPVRITEKKDVLQYYILVDGVDPIVTPEQMKAKFERYASSKQRSETVNPCLYSSNTVTIKDVFPHVFKENKPRSDLVLYHIVFEDKIGSADAQLAIQMSTKFYLTYRVNGRDITKQYVAKLRPVNGNTRSKYLPTGSLRKPVTYGVRSAVKKPESNITPQPVLESTEEKKTPVTEDAVSIPIKSSWNKPVPKSMVVDMAAGVEPSKAITKKPSTKRRGYTSCYSDGTPMKDDGNATVYF